MDRHFPRWNDRCRSGSGIGRRPEDFLIADGRRLQNTAAAFQSFAERLLLDPSVLGTVEVGQLPGPTGVELAASLSRTLRRPVVYEALAPAAFGQLIEPLVGPAAGAVVQLYEEVGKAANHEISRGASAQERLGITPLTTEQWLERALASAPHPSSQPAAGAL